MNDGYRHPMRRYRESDPDERYTYQRRKTIAESSAATIVSLIMGVLGVGGGLYSVFGVAFQTNQNTKDINDNKTQVAALWAARSADKDVVTTSLGKLDDKLSQIIVRMDNKR